MDKLTQKQISFTLDVFKEVPPGQAYMTHYKVKTIAVADACASRLLKNAKVSAYLEELREQAKTDSVATVLERKQILSDIIRFVPEDALELSEDGKELVISRKALRSPAVSYLRTDQTSIADRMLSVRITKLSTTDKVRAINELNKMDNVYSETNIVNDNRQINIIVHSSKTKDLLSQIGDRIVDISDNQPS